MPKTKFQTLFLPLMMAFLMVYAMICYNIFLNIGGMSNQVFLMANGEMRTWSGCIYLEFFLVDKCAQACIPHGYTTGQTDCYHTF